MPKIFEEAGFTGRFVHVVKDGNEAKYWVSPIALASNSGFSQRDLRRVEELVRKYQSDIATLWRTAEEARRNAGRTS